MIITIVLHLFNNDVFFLILFRLVGNYVAWHRKILCTVHIPTFNFQYTTYIQMYILIRILYNVLYDGKPLARRRRCVVASIFFLFTLRKHIFVFVMRSEHKKIHKHTHITDMVFEIGYVFTLKILYAFHMHSSPYMYYTRIFCDGEKISNH